MGALPFLSTGHIGGGFCTIGTGSTSAEGPGVGGRRIVSISTERLGDYLDS